MTTPPPNAAADPMAEIDIEEGKRLLEKATKGPWRAGFDPRYRPEPGEERMEVACVCHMTFDAIDIFSPERGDGMDSWEEHEANAKLIPWLRNNAPALLSRLSAAEQALGHALSMIDEMAQGWPTPNTYTERADRLRAALSAEAR